MNKRASRRTVAAIITVLVIIVVVGVNLLAGVLNSKVDLNLDLTRDKILSLSDLTMETINGLETDVRIISIVPEEFTDSYGVVEAMDRILDKYQKESAHIKYQKVDSTTDPTVFQKYKTKEGGEISSLSVIVETDDRYTVVDLNDIAQNTSSVLLLGVEQSFTSAIQYVVSGKETKVYVLDAHGEVITSDWMPQIVSNQNFTFEPLNITNAPVPDDASLVMILSPKSDFLPEEIDALDAYLDRGGKVILSQDFIQERNTPKLDAYLSEWGISYRSGIVFEQNQNNYYSGNPALIIPEVQQHDLTASIAQNNLRVATMDAQPIDITEVSGVESVPLFQTTAESFVTDTGSVADMEDPEKQGPFPVAVLSTKALDDGKQAKILFLGSLNFLHPQLVNESSFANKDFVVNSIKYLSDESSLLAIGPKDVTPTFLDMSNAQKNFYMILCVIVIPLVILVVGFVVWVWRRRA